tara:strand:+ start:1491 stop:1742 length:252 start_codon:yes stop_codon:yes gene_type:complete
MNDPWKTMNTEDLTNEYKEGDNRHTASQFADGKGALEGAFQPLLVNPEFEWNERKLRPTPEIQSPAMLRLDSERENSGFSIFR